MQVTITNSVLEVTADSAGAEIKSIRMDGAEYLWQRDPKYWRESAPNIFPYVARLTEGTYTYAGQSYSMRIHGFVKYMDLAVAEKSEESVTFMLESSDETRKIYPWDFVYRITYALEDHTLLVRTEIDNRDSKTMYFGVGGHPGFNVPLEKAADGSALSFEDYSLTFEEGVSPVHVGLSEDCFVDGNDRPFVLEEGQRFTLRHDMFDHDAIVLKQAGHSVRLSSDKGSRSVTVRWPDYDVIGFWHAPKTDAPYICIEPWSSLPSRKGIIEDFEKQADLIRLESGKTYKSEWTVTLT